MVQVVWHAKLNWYDDRLILGCVRDPVIEVVLIHRQNKHELGIALV